MDDEESILDLIKRRVSEFLHGRDGYPIELNDKEKQVSSMFPDIQVRGINDNIGSRYKGDRVLLKRGQKLSPNSHRSKYRGIEADSDEFIIAHELGHHVQAKSTASERRNIALSANTKGTDQYDIREIIRLTSNMVSSPQREADVIGQSMLDMVNNKQNLSPYINSYREVANGIR